MLVETVFVEERPTVLYESGNTRVFSKLGRRVNFNTTGVTAAIVRAVERVQQSALPVDGPTGLPDGTDVYYRALPVFGPFNEIYGCQIWLGELGEEVQAPRNVEAFSFDISTNITHHGPGVDRNILSIDSLALSRPSHDNIFSFYDNFPKQKELGVYIKDARDAEGGSARFEADISLTDGQGIGRNIHVSMVNVRTPDNRVEIRGILHEITDIRPHTSNYALAVARRLAAETTPGLGRALVDLTTGIALNWVNHPLGVLDPWNREIPEFTAHGAQKSMNLRQRVLKDSSLYLEFETQVRFAKSGGQWLDVVIGYEHHGDNQGLMTVRDANSPTCQQLSSSA